MNRLTKLERDLASWFGPGKRARKQPRYPRRAALQAEESRLRAEADAAYKRGDKEAGRRLDAEALAKWSAWQNLQE